MPKLNPSWRIPRWKSGCKTNPRWQTSVFFTSPRRITKFSLPRWKCWIIDILRWISGLKLPQWYNSVSPWWYVRLSPGSRQSVMNFSRKYWVKFLSFSPLFYGELGTVTEAIWMRAFLSDNPESWRSPYVKIFRNLLRSCVCFNLNFKASESLKLLSFPCRELYLVKMS